MKTGNTSAAELLDKAVKMLKECGPMKAKNLASKLGLKNARSLSMQLQWAHTRVEYKNGKWLAVFH